MINIKLDGVVKRVSIQVEKKQDFLYKNLMSKALLVIDHGSKVEAANLMLEEVVELLRGQKPGLIVQGCHMELAGPDIEAGIKSCVDAGATEIVAHPFMLSPGRHSTSDIPRMVEEAAKAHPHISVSVTSCLGVHPKIGEVILERAGL